jgi:plastocyanin
MHTVRVIAAAGAIVVAAGLTACSSSGATAGHDTSAPPATSGAASTSAKSGSTVTIDGTDALRFHPSTIAVHGTSLRVRFVDTSSYPHNLEVPALHFKSQTVNGDPGSQSTTFTLHFKRSGTYPFECTYHDSAGMRGKFIVRG